MLRGWPGTTSFHLQDSIVPVVSSSITANHGAEGGANGNLCKSNHEPGGETGNLSGRQHQIQPMVRGSGRWRAVFLLVVDPDGRARSEERRTAKECRPR